MTVEQPSNSWVKHKASPPESEAPREAERLRRLDSLCEETMALGPFLWFGSDPGDPSLMPML